MTLAKNPYSKNKTFGSSEMVIYLQRQNGTPVTWKLPPLYVPFNFSHWGKAEDATSASLELGLDQAPYNRDVQNAHKFLKELDHIIAEFVVAKRNQIFPGFKHLTDEDLGKCYQPITKMVESKTSGDTYYPPRIRVKFYQGTPFSFTLPGARLTTVQDLCEARVVQSTVEAVATLKSFTIKDGKIYPNIVATHGRILEASLVAKWEAKHKITGGSPARFWGQNVPQPKPQPLSLMEVEKAMNVQQ